MVLIFSTFTILAPFSIHPSWTSPKTISVPSSQQALPMSLLSHSKLDTQPLLPYHTVSPMVSRISWLLPLPLILNSKRLRLSRPTWPIHLPLQSPHQLQPKPRKKQHQPPLLRKKNHPTMIWVSTCSVNLNNCIFLTKTERFRYSP